MPSPFSTRKGVQVVLLLGFVLLACVGCATTGEENLSARPWNSPYSWEHGLPTGMMEGR
jgi:hypothetical protein